MVKGKKALCLTVLVLVIALAGIISYRYWAKEQVVLERGTLVWERQCP
jgi:predicted negative regulator of RcsB-dependent stress response